jgi:DNA-binding transcriptional LysR family regulator
MEIDGLSLFVRATELGNITAAGKELGLLPSVASQRLAKLERSLGMRLLHRTTRQVSLTEDGAEFLPHAHNILAAVDEAYLASAHGQNAPKRVLKLAAPGSFARIVLLPMIAKFLAQHPNLKIDLVLSDAIQDLTEIGVDVAIRIAVLKDSTQVARRIGSDHRILCAAPAYLAQHGTPQHPDELAAHQCILLGDEERWVFAQPGLRSELLHGVLRVNCGETARLAAESGLGIVSVSAWNARKALEEGRLVPVLSAWPLAQLRDIWAIYPSSKLISSKARSFVEFLMQECQRDCASAGTD